jgi:hypothetical protein
MATASKQNMVLRDQSLVREAALVGHQWIEVGDGPSIEVTNPAVGETIGGVRIWAPEKLAGQLTALPIKYVCLGGLGTTETAA